uniref:Ig-like domain-containing protein n=1 Tax=Anas platyrhynchos platyrhynchos TaxID=8840 RepID=A0A493U3A4_ANAPP
AVLRLGVSFPTLLLPPGGPGHLPARTSRTQSLSASYRWQQEAQMLPVPRDLHWCIFEWAVSLGVVPQGIAWESGMGKLCGALHGSIAQHCVGTLHRAGKRGSPTTDPIPIPAPEQPQVHIIPTETGNARVPMCLSCHIWGFYLPEVTVIWLHNGDIVEPDDYNPISTIPNGDWSYQTQVSLLVAPVAGDTYMCSVQHVSLQEPLLEDGSEWRGAGPHPEAGGRVLLLLGLGYIYSRGRNKVPPQAAHAQHQAQSKDQPQIRRQRRPAMAGSTR